MHHDPAAAQPLAWRQRFDALVAQRSRTPFAWGSHDCCLWAADAVLAITGVDLAAAYRGTYACAAGAARLLQRLGGLAALGQQVGPAIAPLQATVGDVGLVQRSDRQMLAVCCGAGWLVPGTAGLVLLQLDEALQAWRISHG